ncbi:hypothetical protein [Facklamia sp. 7083-14-GEN3]|uniref:hypothetical protein n=1 Tax=Facklamia sp. 7083-14-GEN3 TaxID=2973478 RepID=UPI00215D332A|nr:hypothetical protein [Facklamia sp. 7083-14-GEN3]MCR8968483.1 hypothetical protein [Facklamia sp. 7083-14-GEN3]
MKKVVKLFITSFILSLLTFNIQAIFANSDSTDEEVNKIEHVIVDDHHEGHHIKANFIPDKILNPDDSLYQAPDSAKEYIGIYKGTAEVNQLGLSIHLILSIEESGLFNLAYYFTKIDNEEGQRFYVDQEEKIQSVEAPYRDLVILTGGLKDFEGGIGSGLIRKTLSPVLLLDTNGKADKFYPYQSLAYELRENYQDARVYQNLGLYIIDKKIVVDINHLIGLDKKEENTIILNATNNEHEDYFLVEQKTYEILQDAFDHYLNNYNDFVLDFENSNDFVQVIQAMHLKTNASFPPDTTFELLDPKKVNKQAHNKHTYALLINKQILYFYDGDKLHVTDQVELIDGKYSSNKWQTN